MEKENLPLEVSDSDETLDYILALGELERVRSDVLKSGGKLYFQQNHWCDETCEEPFGHKLFLKHLYTKEVYSILTN